MTMKKFLGLVIPASMSIFAAMIYTKFGGLALILSAIMVILAIGFTLLQIEEEQ